MSNSITAKDAATIAAKVCSTIDCACLANAYAVITNAANLGQYSITCEGLTPGCITTLQGQGYTVTVNGIDATIKWGP